MKSSNKGRYARRRLLKKKISVKTDRDILGEDGVRYTKASKKIEELPNYSLEEKMLKESAEMSNMRGRNGIVKVGRGDINTDSINVESVIGYSVLLMLLILPIILLMTLIL